MTMNTKKITTLVTAGIGILVILLGIILVCLSPSFETSSGSISYDPSSYNADYAEFGADFYTYMYSASDIIVDELNDINEGLGEVVKAQKYINNNLISSIAATEALIGAVYTAGGIVAIAIGLFILSGAIPGIMTEFVLPKKAVVTEEAAPTEVAE